ncbi:MAG: cache domain-containing protein [Methyloceanibacter sp.]
MVNHPIIALAFVAILASPVNSAEADDLVSPQEIIAKVKEAAAFLETAGEAGLMTFDSSDSPFVWKSTYVFVWDCGADAVVAHPVEGVGLKLSTLEDAAGKLMGPEMCKAAKRLDGGWVEYMWPKPLKVGDADRLAYAETPSRKVTYMLRVKGQPYQVGAGDYNDSLTVPQLDALLIE